MREDSEWGERSQAAALFRADAKMRWLFSWNSELCSGEMLRLAGYRPAQGPPCARGNGRVIRNSECAIRNWGRGEWHCPAFSSAAASFMPREKSTAPLDKSGRAVL